MEDEIDPSLLVLYSKEEKDRIVDMVEKVKSYAKSLGYKLNALLMDSGRFKTIPTPEEIQENKDNIAQQLEGELQLILRKLMGKV